LSLLHQAASLTCNHVFCNSCILRSLKCTSVCPICKVPCSRREVRLAQHMDSLVNIYRNMEMAAGINFFVSQPSISKDSTDGPDKENRTPCQNVLDQKPPEQCGGKSKRAKSCGWKPSRFMAVSLNGVTDNTSTQIIEQKLPAQAIPSPHHPVKHSFPAKKRVQVSLYPPGSVEETPLRPINKLASSEDNVSHNGGGDINDNLVLTSLDDMHFDSDSNMGFCLESKPGVAAQNSIKDAPVIDRVLLDDLGNPVLTPFFWLRDLGVEEANGTQVPTSQPTQFTQITQASPSAHPSFSDLKDSDDEGYHRELQSEEQSIGITVPDTFDSEMFEWTQRPCSPELTSSPKKQQSTKKPEFNQLPPKCFEEDSALLVNGLNKSQNEIIPINTTDSVEGSNMERKQDSAEDGNNNNANIETRGVLQKPSWDKKVKLLSSNEQVCLERKTNEKFRPKGESINANVLGKRKRVGEFKKGSGRNLTKETLSPVRDSVVCASAQESLKDSDKEMAFTAADIFDAMFGLPTNGLAPDSSVIRSHNDTEFEDGECHCPLDLYTNAQNEILENSIINLTPKHQHGVGSIVSGGNLDAITPDGITELHAQASRNCSRSESSTLKNEIVCIFCRTSGDSKSAGQMMHYVNGRAVTESKEMPSNVVHVHKICAEWAPNVYFKDDCIMNLEAEVARGTKIKCSMCGLKGGALGCCFAKCHKSFHVPCALSSSECKWDIDNFVMLCPAHSSHKFLKEKTSRSSKQDSSLHRRGQRYPTEATRRRGAQRPAAMLAGSESSQAWTWPSDLSCKWVLCGSALDAAQKEKLNKFANLVGATISKAWSPAVTHVIASIDTHGACRRTLKFLMAILEGKWVLKTDWITACSKAGAPVGEEGFEITHDIHDTYEGPKRGRLRVEKQAPKLFQGLSFYLSGEFSVSLKGYLLDLVSAAGGVVLLRKPIMGQLDCHSTVVLYNVELPETSKHKDKNRSVQCRLKEAKSLADALGAQFAAHTWVLESVAACQLQPTCNACN
ncbi:hypothetical protein KI387_023887, partial [Taxus chinensis]